MKFRLLSLLFLAHCTTAYNQIANTLSPAEKVYGLSKFWQETNYNFVYLDKIGRGAWDSAYMAFISQVESTKNDYEYYRVLQKFCALLKDGHTEVFPPNIKGLSLMNNTFGDDLVVLRRVDDKVIIKRTWKKDLAKFPLGSEILSVNGIPTDQYMRDSVAVYISASTETARLNAAAMRLLMGPPGSTYSIKIKKPDGKEAGFTLTHAKFTDSVMAPVPGFYTDEQPRPLLSYKALPNDISYVALNSFGNKKIDSDFYAILPRLYKAKSVILDLRFNGGGDDGVAFNILQYFISDTVFTGSATSYRLLDPYAQAVGEFVQPADTANDPDKKNAWLLNHGYAAFNPYHVIKITADQNTRRLSIPVVLLIGGDTESAAEDFVVATDGKKNFTKIGEPTNGSTGQPYHFSLPGGGSARICVKTDRYPDEREFVGYGIPPDIGVKQTVKDYLDNKDVVLDAAIKFLSKK